MEIWWRKPGNPPSPSQATILLNNHMLVVVSGEEV